MVTNPRSQGVARSSGRLGGRVSPRDQELAGAGVEQDFARPGAGLDSARSGVTRRLNEPRPALVEAGVDATPLRVNRRGVALVREEWRVVDRWWTDEPISRRYFDLVLESGENVVVFRDEERESWFTQRA